MTKTKPIRVWASSTHSVWELSDALRQLRVTHTLESGDRGSKTKLVNMKRDQPFPVHVTNDLKGLRPESINFMVSSHGMLSNTNIPMIPLKSLDSTLDQALRECLTSNQLTYLSVVQMSAKDFVNHIAKPSLLNKIQTEILRINPYSFRKEVNALIIDYFNGRCSERTVVQTLNRSLKLEPLKEYVKQGRNLRQAVQLLKTMDPAKIEAQTGISAFDILYLSKAKK